MCAHFALQVEHIRKSYGDYFGIAVAGYPGFYLTSLCLYSEITESPMQDIEFLCKFYLVILYVILRLKFSNLPLFHVPKNLLFRGAS